MPRSIPAGLLAKLDDVSTTLTQAIAVTPKFGSVLRFVKWPHNLVIDGNTYLARPGLNISRTASNLKLEIDNAEAMGYFVAGVITLSDVVAGKFDYATFERILVDAEDISAGSYVYQSGYIGEVTFADSVFKCELRSLAQRLTAPIGVVLSARCDAARVGDARCKWNMGTTQTGTGVAFRSTWSVISALDDHSITASITSGTPLPPNQWFNSGYLIFTSGPNSSIEYETYTYLSLGGSSGVFQMLDRLVYVPAAGNTFTADAGCDRTFDGENGCTTKFRNAGNPTWGNRDNFRGYPHLIGDDYYLPGDSSY